MSLTTLGVFFLLAYSFGLAAKGRMGILAVAAAAIPFNDSAAVLVGGMPVTPFYLGMLVYLPAAYLRNGFPRIGSSLPWLFGAWALTITVVGPALFAGMMVVTSDQRVWSPAELGYATSNLAQATYLVLNLALLMTLAGSQDAKNWIPLVPAIVGTSTAVILWFLRQASIDWPREIFANTSRPYASGLRFPAQFSEPSHLGVFALASAVLLTATVIVQRPRPAVRIFLLAMAAADFFLIIQSASLTALAGAGFFAGLGMARAVYLGFSRGAKAPIGGLLLLLIGIAFVPIAFVFIREVLEYKISARTSLDTRTSADAASWQVFLDTATIGVGLGSNRASSLLLLLVGQIGLVGTGLFLLTMGRAIRDGLRIPLRLPWAASLTALLAASFVSLGDLVSPMAWLLAGFCWNDEQRPAMPSPADLKSPARTHRSPVMSRNIGDSSVSGHR